MKKIMLLTTGGTIASKESGEGLSPSLKADGILGYLSDFTDKFTFSSENVFDLDSSNIQPEEWQILARRVYGCLTEYDGIIITHGTDTMAYTASALSFMLQNLNKGVILTGSQTPISNPFTDARLNLFTALAALELDMKGVMIAFDRKIINGTRAVKTSTMDFDAFASVNTEPMAQMFADGLRVSAYSTAAPSRQPKLLDNLCSDIFLLKLIPGTRPDVIDALSKLNYRAIVIEAFGAGGIHYLHRDLLNKLTALCESGVTVVVCSQCLYERSDLSLYEVGRRILKTGAISALDMTTESTVTKLMWILGQTSNKNEIEKLFYKNIAGEITR